MRHQIVRSLVWYGWVIPAAALIGIQAGKLEKASAAEATVFKAYDVQKGELSPGTQAPTSAQLVSTIETGSASAIQAALEYGERVECFDCIPLLEKKLLEDERSLVREMAAWWLRRRPFGAGQVVRNMRSVLDDKSATGIARARAAEALGEFMEVKSFDALVTAMKTDPDAQVRASSVRALTRLNTRGSELATALGDAMKDADASVRQAALSASTTIRGYEPSTNTDVSSLLSATDSGTRRKAAHVAGKFRMQAAVQALSQCLRADQEPGVRQACAWALGRIGNADAKQALAEAKNSETNSLVRDSINMGL